jgi:hypothetical protein
MKTRLAGLAVTVLGLAASCAFAQYPTVPKELQDAEDAKMQAADQRSDEAFAKAMVQIEKDEAKGKPYIPWAAKPGDLPQASIPAFPGAEGGGAYSFGGRGGKVFVVTSLDDSGPGTLREACEAGGARIVVFNVAGIIHLKDRIRVRAPYISIEGQSAPGDGVCVAGATFAIDTHDVVIRYMRFRRGETNVGNRDDSLGGNPIGNIIIDHCSTSWGLDENMSFYRHMYGGEYRPMGAGNRTTHFNSLKLPTVNVTIQWSISSEALNMYNHAFGSTIGGLNSTFHHNLWACNTGRNPSVGMWGDFTFVNNVLFNWVHRTVDGGDNLSYFNIINNYLKPGPATPANEPIAWRLLKPESQRSRTVVDNFGKAYVAGNVTEANPRVTKDNWDGGVQPDAKAPLQEVLPRIRVNQPFPHAQITMTSAQEALDNVLNSAGATLPRRDAVDQRVIEFVRSGKPTAKPSSDVSDALHKVGYSDAVVHRVNELRSEGIIAQPSDVGGYPEYKGTPYKDSDNDGIPDEWEKKNGLNPNDPADASKDSGDGYTNIEKFLNGIAGQTR